MDTCGTLYIVPTPIGNLGDMTPRALEILKHVNLILAEDTRTTRTLLQHFGVETPMLSHHKYNEHSTLDGFVRRILSGEDIALVSDAGTPGISDPGFMLARECAQNNVPVVTLPGCTAFVPALVSSGMPCDRFVFEGFLPAQKGRATRIAEIAERSLTSVLYESPHRLEKTLTQLMDACGEMRKVSVSREISKKYEETRRGTLKQLVEYFGQNNPRGEFVVVVEGKNKQQVPKIHQNKYKNTNIE